jgi:O-antigen ligase
VLAAGLAAGAALAAAVAAAAPGPVVDALVATRLSADSPERDDLRRVTFDQFAAAPLVGVGTGRLDLVYVDHAGRLVAAQYTHDEYLQTAAETGAVGLALVAGTFCCLGVAAYRRRRLPGGAAAAAVLAAFAAHSAFDFLWHIPVVPLLVVAAVVPLLDRPTHQEVEVTR